MIDAAVESCVSKSKSVKQIVYDVVGSVWNDQLSSIMLQVLESSNCHGSVLASTVDEFARFFNQSPKTAPLNHLQMMITARNSTKNNGFVMNW